MESGPITSWQIEGEKVEAVTFSFLGLQNLQTVTAAMKLKALLLGRKVMTNLDGILKSKDITLPTNVRIVKAIIVYRCDTWIIKKAERQRIDAFNLWYWRRSLRVLWTARRSIQSILKEINPEYS